MVPLDPGQSMVGSVVLEGAIPEDGVTVDGVFVDAEDTDDGNGDGDNVDDDAESGEVAVLEICFPVQPGQPEHRKGTVNPRHLPCAFVQRDGNTCANSHGDHDHCA